MLAARNFNKKESIEKGVVDVYAQATVGTITAPTLSLSTTTPIVLTKASVGTVANTGTVTIQVAAAAANPSNTVLAVFTGTAAAITLTITPNDGTNNTATPVNITAAQLAEFLDSGAVAGKTVTVTDASSLAAIIDSATGGGAQNLVDSGEGDGVTGTWAGGSDAITQQSVLGVTSVTRNDVGDYTVTLQDPYYALRNLKVVRLNSSAQDLNVQLHSETVSTTKLIRVLFLTGATPTDPSASTVLRFKMELKNSSVR